MSDAHFIDDPKSCAHSACAVLDGYRWIDGDVLATSVRNEGVLDFRANYNDACNLLKTCGTLKKHTHEIHVHTKIASHGKVTFLATHQRINNFNLNISDMYAERVSLCVERTERI